MKIEDIVNSLNVIIRDKRIKNNINIKGKLVLQKTIIPNTTVKVFKDITFTLWFIKGKIRTKILEVAGTEKVLFKDYDNIIDKYSIELCRLLMFCIMDKSWVEQLVNGDIKNEF